MLRSLIHLGIAGLFVAQLTRLVVDDRFPFAPVRRWLEDGSREGAWVRTEVYELVACPWCFSGWAALGAVIGLEVVGPVPVPVLAWFAVWRIGILAYHAAEALARYATR